MIRRAFTMRLKPGAFDEYKHHHDNVWPELVDEIRRSGIASITTFRRGDDMFLVSEITNEQAWDRLWHSDIHKEWAKVMEPLMNLTPEGIVDAGELTEIFHVETTARNKDGSRPASNRKKKAVRAVKKSTRAKPTKKSSPKDSRKKAAKAPRKKKIARR